MDASSARKKLQNIPDKLSIYKQYAEKASKNKELIEFIKSLIAKFESKITF